MLQQSGLRRPCGAMRFPVRASRTSAVPSPTEPSAVLPRAAPRPPCGVTSFPARASRTMPAPSRPELSALRRRAGLRRPYGAMPCALRASRTSAVPSPTDLAHFLAEPLLRVGAEAPLSRVRACRPLLLGGASRLLQRSGESLFVLVADRARISFEFRAPLSVRFRSRLQQLV